MTHDAAPETAGDAEIAPLDLPEPDRSEIRRYAVVETELPPIAPGTAEIAASGLVLLTWDETGLATEIGDRLQALGYHTAYVAFPWQMADARQTFRLIKISEESIDSMFQKLMATSVVPFAGLIHVAQAHGKYPDVLSAFDAREIHTLKALFLMARAFATIPRPAAPARFFAAATRMDGRLGIGGESGFLQGGVAGMLKALAREWPDVLVRVVDLPARAQNDRCAAMFLEELMAPRTDVVEIGRLEDRRVTLSLRERYDEDPARQLPGREDIFLITGGGRGVCAACAQRLAAEYASGFLLLGRSRIGADLSWAEGETEDARLRSKIIANLRASGQPVKPADIERALAGLRNQRDVEATIGAIRAAGGRCVYLSCDVTDENAVRAAVAEGENALGGRVTGLIHGAGVLADKHIDRKTAQDFDAVFAPKIKGLEACLKAIDPDALKSLMLFSSVAAFFGNEGQVDYSTANEALNKFAYAFRAAHPHVLTLAINWGPWRGGMVTEALQTVIDLIGEKMIPLDTGAAYLAQQYRYDFAPGACQIAIAGTDQYIPHDVSVKDLIQNG